MALIKSTGAVMPHRKGDYYRQQKFNLSIYPIHPSKSFFMKGADKMQTVKAKSEQPREHGTFTKRIGSTNYRVSVHFNPNSKETVNDKIIRMIKNETAGKAAGE